MEQALLKNPYMTADDYLELYKSNFPQRVTTDCVCNMKKAKLSPGHAHLVFTMLSLEVTHPATDHYQLYWLGKLPTEHAKPFLETVVKYTCNT